MNVSRTEKVFERKLRAFYLKRRDWIEEVKVLHVRNNRNRRKTVQSTRTVTRSAVEKLNVADGEQVVLSTKSSL